MKARALRARSVLLLLGALLSASFLGFGLVHVAAEQCIPVSGQKWMQNYVGVYVAGGVSDIQKQQVLLAINVWYSAQQWFIDSYEGGVGSPYLLYLTDKPGDGVITVSFFIGQDVSFAGRALNFAYTLPDNALIKGEIQINLPPEHASNPNDLMVESIILHEFGHGFGLGHSDISEDAMYAIDNYPANYGLPSTLDLYALYKIKDATDPATLGGGVCLPSSIGYGLPPWIQQSGNQLTISYPGGKFVSSYDLAAGYSALTTGASSAISLSIKCTADYPMQVVSLSGETDFGQSLSTIESLPTTIEPGLERRFTMMVNVPSTLGVGAHSFTFKIGAQVLTTSGWSSQVNYDSWQFNFQVIEPNALAVSTYTFPVGVVPDVPTIANEPNKWNFATPLFLTIGFVVLAISAAAFKASRHKAGKYQTRTTGLRCSECGAQIPRDSKFCKECGKSTGFAQ